MLGGKRMNIEDIVSPCCDLKSLEKLPLKPFKRKQLEYGLTELLTDKDVLAKCYCVSCGKEYILIKDKGIFGANKTILVELNEDFDEE